MKNDHAVTRSSQLCAVDYAFKRIGGKYKARILWYLDMKSILRYGELSRTLPDITTKMLTQTLRELEDDKLIVRKMYHEVPPKVEYSLSETGKELIPFIAHLHAWGKKQIMLEAQSFGMELAHAASEACKAVCPTDRPATV
ncbi:winged helix-turn-helix transcriptional regulator [Mucilaginibacter pedocola]|uniref:winged helix-turn-helix transcriptional regulator n=1 Tax=Mucilaginibacter pedocola TaxID=1792845 RepID=UPI000992E43C|nr:winged helix-turn-helix transcriptional regulator [Mucilaginibacter pedocola]